jgi:prephenate dehydrogenase
MGTIAIIGLGLIGGSIGLALKRAEPVNTTVIGYDRDAEVTGRAVEFKAVQRPAPSAADAVKDATMVIIAVPTISVRRVFEEIAPHLSRGTVVTDTASTKSDVMRWARECLPPGVHFVGGHPMAGKETSGPQAAEESLFDDRPYCLVPALDASQGAVNAVEGYVKALGGRPFYMDAEEHDSYAAAISHVPLVASLALFKLAHRSAAWPELASMSGPAFRDLTRLASGEPEMSHDIFLTNRNNLGHWLDRFIEELLKLRTMIEDREEGASEALFRDLVQTQMDRDTFLMTPPKREDGTPDPDLPSSGESFMSMLAGSLWQNRAKEISDATEERLRRREFEERIRRRTEGG